MSSTAVVPSGAGLYASIDADRSGDQWKNVQTLLAKLPGGESVLDSFLEDALKDVGGPGEVVVADADEDRARDGGQTIGGGGPASGTHPAGPGPRPASAPAPRGRYRVSIRMDP